MILISNENLSQETFPSFMASLVSATKTKSGEGNESILISKERVTTLIKLLSKLSEFSNVSTSPSTEEQQVTEQSLHALKSIIIKRRHAFMTDNALDTCISLNDAGTALEEVSIGQKDIRKPHAGRIRTSTLLAHTTLARRFQRRKRHKQQREEFRPNRHQTEFTMTITADMTAALKRNIAKVTGNKTILMALGHVAETALIISPIIFSKGLRS